MVRISSIILAYDQDPRMVETCIDTTLKQNFNDFETILINNSSKYSSMHGKNWYGVKTIHTEDIPRGQARNKGVYASNGELLVFIDADTFMCGRDHFSKISKYGETFSHGYGAKRFWTYPPQKFQNEIDLYKKALSKGNFAWVLDEKRAILPKGLDRTSGYRDLKEFTFPTNFGFVSRNLFYYVEGFNPEFNEYGGEDDYLAYSCYKADPKGYKLLKELSVLHVNHPISTLDKDGEKENMGYKIFHKLMEREGYSAFNINVLFGIPDEENEPVLVRNKK